MKYLSGLLPKNRPRSCTNTRLYISTPFASSPTRLYLQTNMATFSTAIPTFSAMRSRLQAFLVSNAGTLRGLNQVTLSL